MSASRAVSQRSAKSPSVRPRHRVPESATMELSATEIGMLRHIERFPDNEPLGLYLERHPLIHDHPERLLPLAAAAWQRRWEKSSSLPKNWSYHSEGELFAIGVRDLGTYGKPLIKNCLALLANPTDISETKVRETQTLGKVVAEIGTAEQVSVGVSQALVFSVDHNLPRESARYAYEVGKLIEPRFREDPTVREALMTSLRMIDRKSTHHSWYQRHLNNAVGSMLLGAGDDRSRAMCWAYALVNEDVPQDQKVDSDASWKMSSWDRDGYRERLFQWAKSCVQHGKSKVLRENPVFMKRFAAMAIGGLVLVEPYAALPAEQHAQVCQIYGALIQPETP